METPSCAPTVKLFWDQWAVASVTCTHGVYSATSRGQMDMFSAVRDSWIKYLSAHGAYGEYLADWGITADDLM